MSSVLYYSKYCKNCDSIISRLSKTSIQKDIHFICIDKRVKEGNKIYLLLEGGKKVLLPETVKKVPAILLLYQGYRVLYGKDIMNYYQPKINAETGIATQNNLEPIIRVGNLKSARDFIDVRDGVSGMILLLEKGMPGEPINICTGKSWTISNIFSY